MYSRLTGGAGLLGGGAVAQHYLHFSWMVLLPFTVISMALVVWSSVKLRLGERRLKQQRLS